MRVNCCALNRACARIAGTLLAALSIAAIAGCSLFSPVEDDIQVGVIDQLPAEIPQRETHAATLMVLPPAINPVYDTVRMAYRVRPHQVEYFSRHEWGATPAQMLQPLLARTLENTHYFHAVLSPPYFGPYNYALRTEILELTQDFTSKPATLQLSLRVQLVDGGSNRVIANRAISLHEPLLQEAPYAGIVAANEATAKTLQEVARFVLGEMP